MVPRLDADADPLDAIGLMMHANAAVSETVAVDVKPLAELTPREVVNALEQEMLKLPQLALPVTHLFSPGIYARQLFIPAGTFLTGRIHKFAHLNIMLSGDMNVLLESGMTRVQVPFTCVSPPGTKRIAFAFADTVWMTIHPTDETDIEKLEDLLTAKDEADYLAFVADRDQQLKMQSAGKFACLS